MCHIVLLLPIIKSELHKSFNKKGKSELHQVITHFDNYYFTWLNNISVKYFRLQTTNLQYK